MKTIIIIFMSIMIGMSFIVGESVKFGSELKAVNNAKVTAIESALADMSK